MFAPKIYKDTASLLKGSGFRTAGIYTFSNFFSKGLSFLLIPIFTNPRFLTPEDNGLISLFGKAIIFLIPFINLGVLQSASVDFFKLNKKGFKDLCTTGVAMSFTMSLLVLGLSYIFSDYFITKFSFPTVFIWAIPLAAFMTFCYEMIILIIRNRDNPIQYLKINMTRVSLELGLAVILIVLFSFGWLGRVSGLLIAGTIIAVYAFYFLIKNDYLFGKIRKDIVYSELKYSGPIITMQLSMFCLFSSDSFLLSAITQNNAEVGIYGIACIFGSIIITLGSALIQYMAPKINKELSLKNPDYSVIKKLSKNYFKVMITGWLILLIVVPLVYKLIIDPIYWEGSKYFYFLSTGYFFWTVSAFLYTFLLFHKEKKKLFFLASLSILISLTGNYYFIQTKGAWGASISVCLSYFLVLLLSLLFTKKYWRPIFFNIKVKE